MEVLVIKNVGVICLDRGAISALAIGAISPRYEVKHILLDCVDFSDQRPRFYSSPNLKHFFTQVPGHQILSFLKAIILVFMTFFKLSSASNYKFIYII